MANVLKMEKQILIQQLLALGWSYRRIQAETGIRRETVAKYDLRRSENARPVSKPAKVPTDLSNCPPINSISRSHAARYDQIIRKKLSKGLHAKRIYQDLVTEFGYPHSYDSIKRYVRSIKKKSPKVYARIHTPPGQEAQVDFGQGAPTLKNGKYVKPWLFKMVLSFSRHSYEEVVRHQDVETFIRCHENAFASFGGVPELIRLDNLKSGVLKANLYEPILNPAYEAFAKHAGFVPLPCLPRKPEHKGKVESGIGYTQNNALKGLKFESLDAQNAHLRHWNKTWAGTRIHGTTKKQVRAVFAESERHILKPLPKASFPFFKLSSRTVHPDGHIEVDRAYYSVPHKYIGQRVTVHYNSLWVKAFVRGNRVAFHKKAGSGRFKTERNHLPQNKSISSEEYKQHLLHQAQKIGPECVKWARLALKTRNQLAFRAIQGVLRLSDKYAHETINHACSEAARMGRLRYHTVKLLCDDNLRTHEYGPNPQTELLQEHDIIRSIDDYQNIVNAMTNTNTQEK
jgi:transposase